MSHKPRFATADNCSAAFMQVLFEEFAKKLVGWMHAQEQGRERVAFGVFESAHHQW